MRRILILIAGWIVLAIGIILIPYPGPGWLIVFGGLAILSAEYTWAGRTLHHTRTRYERWNEWIATQHITVRSLAFIGTSIVVVVTLWLLNTYGIMNDWLELGQPWLRSPFLW